MDDPYYILVLARADGADAVRTTLCKMDISVAFGYAWIHSIQCHCTEPRFATVRHALWDLACEGTTAKKPTTTATISDVLVRAFLVCADSRVPASVVCEAYNHRGGNVRRNGCVVTSLDVLRMLAPMCVARLYRTPLYAGISMYAIPNETCEQWGVPLDSEIAKIDSPEAAPRVVSTFCVHDSGEGFEYDRAALDADIEWTREQTGVCETDHQRMYLRALRLFYCKCVQATSVAAVQMAEVDGWGAPTLSHLLRVRIENALSEFYEQYKVSEEK